MILQPQKSGVFLKPSCLLAIFFWFGRPAKTGERLVPPFTPISHSQPKANPFFSAALTEQLPTNF
jgi:hypothetical protein